jgi:hypothetical protein
MSGRVRLLKTLPGQVPKKQSLKGRAVGKVERQDLGSINAPALSSLLI